LQPIPTKKAISKKVVSSKKLLTSSS